MIEIIIVLREDEAEALLSQRTAKSIDEWQRRVQLAEEAQRKIKAELREERARVSGDP